jgi:HlyD family secretion protein
MNPDQLERLRIEKEAKKRPKLSPMMIFAAVAVFTGVAAFLAWPKKGDAQRIFVGKHSSNSVALTQSTRPRPEALPPATNATPKANAPVLTVSGYIINRERIELSPRFMGVVNWIGVKKGDAVTNGQVVVLLDDAEFKARLAETQGRLTAAKVAVERAELEYERIRELSKQNVESKQIEDNARLAVAAAKANVQELEGQLMLIRTYLDWTVIKSPINGVVLEKLVDPNELVMPQSFGGTRGPSTTLIALADTRDMQVEVDLNESDLAKVFLNQKCRVSPEAYLDKSYDGYVAEIAPEANRQKGTLQVKVQIRNPDRFLTPELSAKVEFLSDRP